MPKTAWEWAKLVAFGAAFLAFVESQHSARHPAPFAIVVIFYALFAVMVVAGRGPRPWRTSLLALGFASVVAIISAFNSWQLIPRAWSDIGSRWPG